MDTFRLLLMRKVDLILSAYTHHGLRFSFSGGLAGILYMPRCLSAGRPTHIFTITSGGGNFIRLHGVPCSHYIDDNYIDTSVRCASSQARVMYICQALV